MPSIPYEAHSFPHGVPLWSASTKMPAYGHGQATRSEIYSHAISVGSPWGQSWWNYFGRGQPAFQRKLFAWKGAAVNSCLAEDGGYWTLRPFFEHLDGSEKSFLSYLMGMTQASIMSEHILGATTMIHVDSVLKMLGKLHPKESRPDLIGFHPSSPINTPQPVVPTGRLLMEAKGSHRKRTSTAITDAKNQVKPTPRQPRNFNHQQLAFLVGKNALRVASVAHFDRVHGAASTRKVWSSYLEDPTDDASEAANWDDDEFLGLLLLAKLLPLYISLNESPIERFAWPDYITPEVKSFQLDDGVVIGMPTAFLPVIDEYLSEHNFRGTEEMLRNDYRILRKHCRSLAGRVSHPAKLAPKAREPVDGWEFTRQRSGLSLALQLESLPS